VFEVTLLTPAGQLRHEELVDVHPPDTRPQARRTDDENANNSDLAWVWAYDRAA
jgi:hypothetical protein